MADESTLVDEVEATGGYQWPRRPGAEGPLAGGGAGLPTDGPPVAYAAEPGRPLGPVLPWLGRSFRTAGRILGPAWLVLIVAELAVWLPMRVLGPLVLPRGVQLTEQFGRVILVHLAGALVLHQLVVRHLGLRAGLGRAVTRTRTRLGPVLVVAVVSAGMRALTSIPFALSLRPDGGVWPWVTVGLALLIAVLEVPILFAAVVAVAGPAGVNPFVGAWRTASGRWRALAGRQLILFVLSFLASAIVTIAAGVLLSPLLDLAGSDRGSLPWIAYDGAHLLVHIPVLIVVWAAIAELYLAAGGTGEV